MGITLAGSTAGWGRASEATPGRDRSEFTTPQRTVRFFVEECRKGNYGGASKALDLTDVRFILQPIKGPLLARRLLFVLDQTMYRQLEQVEDELIELEPIAENTVVLGYLKIDGEKVPVSLSKVPLDEPGTSGWLFDRKTVSRIPLFYSHYGAGWLGEQVPAILIDTRFLGMEAWQWVGLLLAIPVALPVGWVLSRLTQEVLSALTRRTSITWDDRLVDAGRGPLRALLTLGALDVWLYQLHLNAALSEALTVAGRLLLVLASAWLALRLVRTVSSVAEETFTAQAGDEDEPRLRVIRTEIAVVRRVVAASIIVMAIALALVQFELVRTMGVSLLTSAGIVGITIGLAAQRSIAALIAGTQLMITQPLRLGDVIIVEGEYGTVEEITLTYIVVRVWDLRRLVVPITRFLDHPFQNWTKVSCDLYGIVEIYADYTAPVETIRAEAIAYAKHHRLWDGQKAQLLVTAASEKTILLRITVSAGNPDNLFDLRCDMREHMIGYLQKLDGGKYLPRTRVDTAVGGAG